MEARIRKLFSGKSSSKAHDELPLKSQAYENVKARDAPVKISYPVAISSPGLVREVPRTKVPQNGGRLSTFAPAPSSFQFERSNTYADRPSTAPHSGFASSPQSAPYARTHSGFSMKSPPNFSRKGSIATLNSAETQSVRAQSPRNHLSRMEHQNIRIPTGAVEPQKVRSPLGVIEPLNFQTHHNINITINESKPSRVENDLKHNQNQTAQTRSTPSASTQNGSSKPPQNRNPTAYVDLIDAASSIKPDYNKSRHKATGKRDYGEDVADRNIADFGGSALTSPEYNYLPMIYGREKAKGKEQIHKREDNSAWGQGLGIHQEVDEKRSVTTTTRALSRYDESSALPEIPSINPDRNSRSKSSTPPSGHDTTSSQPLRLSVNSVKSYTPSRASDSIRLRDSATSQPHIPTERTLSISSRNSGIDMAKAAIAASSPRNVRHSPPVSYKPPAPEFLSRGKTASIQSFPTPPMSPREFDSPRSSFGGDRVEGSPQVRSRGNSITYSAFPPQYSSKHNSQASNMASERSSRELTAPDKPRPYVFGSSHNAFKRGGLVLDLSSDSDGLGDLVNTSDAEVITDHRPGPILSHHISIQVS